MKPSFALDFRDGRVTLLHRTSRGWSQVATTAFDAPDLSEALGYMRSTALGLSPRGITTKLIIPNEQILYTQVHAPGPEPAKRRRQIRAGLEGLTPYPLDDLVYDWWGAGPDLQVAVLSKETLAEAEAFANEHRFNPVSFVAVPDNGAYLAEPFFGPSSLSATLLTQGEKVERESEPVSVVVRDFPRADPVASPMPQPAPRADAEPAAKAESGQMSKLQSEPVSETESAPQPVSAPQPESAPQLAEDTKPDQTAEASAASGAPAESSPGPVTPDSAPVLQTAYSGVPAPAKATSPFDTVSPDPWPLAAQNSAPPQALGVEPKADNRPVVPTPALPTAAPVSMAKPATPVPEAPMAVDVASGSIARAQVSATSAASVDSMAAFASRRTAAIAAATAGLAKPAASDAAAFTGGLATGAVGASAATNPTGPATGPRDMTEVRIPAVGAAPSLRPTVPRPPFAKASASLATVPVKSSASSARPAIAKPLKSSMASPIAPGIQGAKRDRNVVQITPAATGKDAISGKASQKPLTGLGNRSPAVNGKPPYLGLILTAILLVLLVAVALWSSWNLGTKDTTGTGSLTAPAADQTAALAAAQVSPAQVIPAPAPSSTDAMTQAGASASAYGTSTDTITTAGTPPPDPAVTIGTQGTATSPPADQTAANLSAADLSTADLSAKDMPTSDLPAADLPNADLPTTMDEAASDGQMTLPADASAAAATPAQAAPTPQPAPKTEVANAGIEPTPLGDAVQDEIFLASADTPPKTSDPVTLPVFAASADTNPAEAPPPPPFGTVYKFDADGRIIPTPDGIMTPEGVLLIAGKPALVPPSRPADVATQTPVAQTPDLPGALTAVAPDAPTPPAPTTSLGGVGLGAITAPLPQDPTLVGKHPQDRPADLTPLADQQGTASDLAPDSRFASLRPQAHPAELYATAALVNPAAQASLAANGFAMATSLKPAARPSGLKVRTTGAGNDTVTEALKQPVPDAQTASFDVAPQTQTDLQVEPQTEAAAPNLPTNASVAKQSTVKHALATNRVALLAVFGTPSSRFAMIRRADGAVKKVQVGDTVDGGRIAGISANTVQYQRGGQMITLSMPTG